MQIGLHPAAAEALVKAGEAVPAPLAGTGIIDTGASITSIGAAIAEQLGLAENGSAELRTASGPVTVPTYAFSVAIPGLAQVQCHRGVGCDLGGQDIAMLLGMDLLSHCLFIINGPGGRLTISL